MTGCWVEAGAALLGLARLTLQLHPKAPKLLLGSLCARQDYLHGMPVRSSVPVMLDPVALQCTCATARHWSPWGADRIRACSGGCLLSIPAGWENTYSTGSPEH